MSKGSKRRPQQVDEMEMARRWALVFRQGVDVETFEALWYDEIQCIAAETGADRELDFDSERFLENLHTEFQEGIYTPPYTGW
jgi:hypothetical protein